ncbi:GNAT family N-acetyltransferase [Clostridium pasteurianum]|uniref:Putative acyltransferase n=1 Tax=Clostridium pasteurianum BC1 TaxID=86416 RepID=R4K2M3_CLOPA|nr:GNAT family N-acetyltransferase [Clostridium pasteurianum]AGK96838.1 putative acyltransferase [Clostridium pasteurianum BC1]
MASYKYLYINNDSGLYKEVVELRYRIFFKPFNCSMDMVFDNLEGESIHLVCCHNNIVAAGYARLNIIDKTAQISQVVVKEEYRKKGIGSELIRELTDKSRESGMKKIILNAKIEIVNLYRSLGYETVGQEFPSIKTGLSHIRMEKII